MKTLPKNINILKVLPLASLLFFLSFVPARAQEVQRSITFDPSIAQTMDPGTKKEGILHVTNNSDGALTFNNETKDFIVVDTLGTPNVLPVGTLNSKYSAAAWLGVSPSSFTLQPHQTQELHYYIQVPPDARPGGHYAAIVYTPTIQAATGQTGSNVNSELGTLFYITVNGPVIENSLVSLFIAPFSEYGPVDILTQIRNLGDLHIRPLGNIVVTNMLGGKSFSALKEQNIFPGGVARDYNNLVGGKFMLGKYNAQLMATYGKNNDKVLIASVSFWVFPWKLTIIIILIIIAIILGVKFYKKSKKVKATPAEEEAVS